MVTLPSIRRIAVVKWPASESKSLSPFGARYERMPLRQSTERTEDKSQGWFSSVRGRSEERTRDESTATRTGDESKGLLGRARAKYGLGALLVVAGVALFLFPEPATSAAGIALIGLGALVWLVSWLR